MKKAFCLLALLLPLFAHAEDVTNLKRLNLGYSLDINGVSHRALPASTFKTLQEKTADDAKTIDKLVAQVTALQAQLKSAQANAADYQEALAKQTNLNKKYQDLNDDYSQLNLDYKNTAKSLVELNKKYSGTLSEFDDLVEKYRKVAVRTHPRSMWDFGLGMLKPTAAGSDPHYFATVGSGVKLLNTEFRGWLLVGTDSYGLMAGLSF